MWDQIIRFGVWFGQTRFAAGLTQGEPQIGPHLKIKILLNQTPGLVQSGSGLDPISNWTVASLTVELFISELTATVSARQSVYTSPAHQQIVISIVMLQWGICCDMH